MGKREKARSTRETPRQVWQRYRSDARRLGEFSKFTRLTKVERMALDCFEALAEALGSRR